MKVIKQRKSPYCLAPFGSPAVTPTGFKMCSGPCAKSYPTVDFWNGKEMQEIRRQWLNDEVPKECEECYLTTGGVTSGNFIPEKKAKTILPLNFDDLYLARSNRCDLACEMCSADISHTWDKIRNKGKLGIIDNNFDLTPYLKDTYSIAISGGNPVLDHKINDIIKALDNNKITRFLITSNGSVFPDKMLNNIINMEFKCMVLLIFSIDGPKEFNEKARFPAKQERIYKTINSVIEKTKHIENIHVCIEFTGTNESVRHVIGLYEEIKENLPTWPEYRGPFPIPNICCYPDKLALQNVDDETWEYMQGELHTYFLHKKRECILAAYFYNLVTKYTDMIRFYKDFRKSPSKYYEHSDSNTSEAKK